MLPTRLKAGTVGMAGIQLSLPAPVLLYLVQATQHRGRDNESYPVSASQCESVQEHRRTSETGILWKISVTMDVYK
jgi:hypothetical protein